MSLTSFLHRDRGNKLNELEATAICGNDITSSCLYVSALTILQAGKWAPLALVIVAAVLFLYRKIYAEVVGALPLNGGAYNALLNTTSKKVATLAACLTLLSYMATAVISASEAVQYVHALWSGLPVVPVTIVLLAAFMVLTIMGIGESARVAVFIFIIHIATLFLLLGVGVVFIFRGGPATPGREPLRTHGDRCAAGALFWICCSHARYLGLRKLCQFRRAAGARGVSQDPAQYVGRRELFQSVDSPPGVGSGAHGLGQREPGGSALLHWPRSQAESGCRRWCRWTRHWCCLERC